MWAYLVNQSTALSAGRRLRTGSNTLRSGKAVADTQTAYLRTSTRVVPGRVVDKPVTGTPTTGDGLPNPDPRTTFRPPQTPSQKQAQQNIENTPGSAAQEWARKLWEAMRGQSNPWYHNGDPITGEEDINADHIIPKRPLSNYIGFDTLPADVQKSIADMKENIWPVPGEINKANKDKPKTRRVSKGGAPLPPEILAEAIRGSDAADKAIRGRILQELLNNQSSPLAPTATAPASPPNQKPRPATSDSGQSELADHLPRKRALSRVCTRRPIGLGTATTQDLATIAHSLNTRPRKTLGWHTPTELFDTSSPCSRIGASITGIRPATTTTLVRMPGAPINADHPSTLITQ